MSHASRALSQSHVLSTSLPPSQPLHPVTRTRKPNSAHRRWPPLTLCSTVDRTYTPDCRICHSAAHRKYICAVAAGRLPCFQARGWPEERLNSLALCSKSIRGGGNPVLQPDIAPGGNTQYWNSATIARARQARIFASPTRTCWVDQGGFFSLGQSCCKWKVVGGIRWLVLSWVASIILGAFGEELKKGR